MQIYTISSSNGKNFKVEKGVPVGYRKMRDGGYIPCVRVGSSAGRYDHIPVRLSRMNHQNWKRFLNMNLRGGRMHRDKCGYGGNLQFGTVPMSLQMAEVGQTKAGKPNLTETDRPGSGVLVVWRDMLVVGDVERWTCQNRDWGESGCDTGYKNKLDWPGFVKLPHKCPCCGKILAMHLRVSFKRFPGEVLVKGIHHDLGTSEGRENAGKLDVVATVTEEDGVFHAIREDRVLTCRVVGSELTSKIEVFMRQSICAEVV